MSEANEPKPSLNRRDALKGIVATSLGLAAGERPAMHHRPVREPCAGPREPGRSGF